MPLVPINVTWDTPQGSYGVLVEYRNVNDSVWIKPTTAPNPTMAGEYELTLETNEFYYIRLSSDAPNCNPYYVFRKIFVPSGTCCPPTYTLSPDSTYCYKVEEVAATPPSSSETAVAQTNNAYSTCGSYIYDIGYAPNGTGSAIQIPVVNPFWVNGSGSCADSTNVNGPLNRTGLWSSTTLPAQTIGFGICITIPTEKVYYVGIGCDNYGIIKLDGVTLLQQDPAGLAAQYGVGPASTFKIWHIYPVELTAGPHFLEIIGYNDSGPAALGCEVYDATPAELNAATSYAALGSKLIFSSKDFIGQTIQLGSDGIGYTCPAGYSLSSCDGPTPVCKRILTTSTTTC